VRLAFNVDSEKPPPVFPPPRGEPSLIDSLDVPTKPIPGIPDLMHHKYAIRDGARWIDDVRDRYGPAPVPASTGS
jgi:hypothetical protein